MWNTTADDNSDMASDGGWEEPKEDMTPEGEDEELESEYVPGARKYGRLCERLVLKFHVLAVFDGVTRVGCYIVTFSCSLFCN